MYGLSPETDLSLLNGCTLTFVGFGEHQLQLAFSGDVDLLDLYRRGLHRGA